MAEVTTLERIRSLLRENHVEFREIHHGPTPTSQEAAEARGEPLRIGGKAIVGKVGEAFHVFVFSAARRLDSVAVRKRFGARKFRFATPEELLELTGLRPGSVPPFGRPILPLDLYVDSSILDNDRIAFNAGSLTDSIVLDRESYLRVARPAAVFSFSRNPGP
jgi:prolyl-tRNA editing enzyme YbaK/EbsC (Cys-tRNA(Pro) deacylase)